MNFLSLFSRKDKEVKPLEIKMTSAELLDEVYSGWESTAGVPITWRQAISLSAVMACVRVMGNGLAQVPFVLFKSEGRKRTRAYQHPLYELLHDAPNDYQTSFDFRFMLTMHLMLTGNAFVWINRVGDRVVELLPLDPSKVCIQRNGWDVQYMVTGESGKQYTLSRQDVWHIKEMSFDGVVGLDSVKLARDILGLSSATENYGAKFFKNGGRPTGILSTAVNMSTEQRSEMRDYWELMNSGMQNANKTAVTWGDWKYTPIGTPNDQSQFLETRKFQIEEICRALGVNPIMVFYSDKNSTYASVEQMFLAHVVHSLSPLYTNFEQSAAVSLLSQKERAEGYYVQLVANGLMRGAAKDRAEYYKTMRIAGLMTINEIRELEELNPMEGGDDLFTPLNSNVSGRTSAEGTGDDNGS